MRNGWNPFCVYALQICLRIVVLFQSTWPPTVKRTFAFRVSSLMMTVLTTYVLLRNTGMIGCKSSFTDRTHVSTSELQRVIAVHMERRSRRTKAKCRTLYYRHSQQGCYFTPHHICIRVSLDVEHFVLPGTEQLHT